MSSTDAAPAPAAIRISHATVKLEGAEILKDLSWTVRKGERWFMLGPNGAGKTTLVKLALGLLWPIYGAEVSVLGFRYGACDISEVRRRIAWVSPFLQAWTSSRWTMLDIALSGLDSSIGFYRTPSKAEVGMAMEALVMMGAAHLAERHFDMVSSGEQVKALIARALICQPELAILDEACVHLDLRSRETLLAAIDALAARADSPTILFVTQRIEEITESFRHGLILEGGRIVAQGLRQEVLTEANLKSAFGIDVRLRPGSGGRLWPSI